MVATLTRAECREIARILARDIDHSRVYSNTAAYISCESGELEIKGFYSYDVYFITEAKCITENNEVIGIELSDLEAIEQEVNRIS